MAAATTALQYHSLVAHTSQVLRQSVAPPWPKPDEAPMAVTSTWVARDDEHKSMMSQPAPDTSSVMESHATFCTRKDAPSTFIADGKLTLDV